MGVEKLLEPFTQTDIGLLPKQLSKDDRNRAKCERGSSVSADGRYCGGYHARAIHLDYVGHAALTKRLLEADPEWSWEPLAVADNGMPLLDQNGGLWIRLTVAGVSRIGYGDAQGKSGGNAVKEAIGDALRNAGMRFGAALELWHKGDLSDFADAQGAPSAPVVKPVGPPEGWREKLAGIATVDGLQAYYEESAHAWFTPEVQAAFTARQAALT
jgi:hypothetical protein